jgi:hypothetical protein
MTTVPLDLGSLPVERAWVAAKLGWRVMPLRKDSKLPAIKDWPNKATTDVYQIDEWWNGTHAGANVGILTGPESDIWVLDIDTHWCNGFASVRALFHGHGISQIPNTFRVASPSGGQQWYFRYPASGKKVRNISSEPDRPGPLGAGLDVRGWHGMVVAPGAIGRNVINDVRPIYAPGWLEEIVTTPAVRSKKIETVSSGANALRLVNDYVIKLSAQRAGRNSTLNTMAFQLGLLGGRGLLDEDDARNALLEACRANGAIEGPDAWKDGQFDATFTSGWSAGVIEGARA